MCSKFAQNVLNSCACNYKTYNFESEKRSFSQISYEYGYADQLSTACYDKEVRT